VSYRRARRRRALNRTLAWFLLVMLVGSGILAAYFAVTS
jgi:hypothetical protein